MKKMTYFYIIIGLFFLSILSISSTTVAWRNGLNTFTTPGVNPIASYKEDYTKTIATNTMRDFYGTHDYIAESALELLYNLRSSNSFLSQLWDRNNPDNLRIYYLYGTELPDSFIIPSSFTTRCGFKFELKFFLTATTHNRLLFYDDPSSPFYTMPKDDSACLSAQSIYNQIVSAFEERDCQAAATFIGALMHVISDATYYPHLGFSRSVEYEYHVMHCTFRTWADVNGDRSNEFFNLAEVQGKLTAGDEFNPYLATLLAGRNTHFGSLLYQDAEFLHYSAPSVTNRQFWQDVEGHWTDYQQEHSWIYSYRPSVSGTSAKKYFDTVEHNLNQAVYYCATALNYVLNHAGYTDCDCGASSGQNPNPPPPQGNKESLTESLQLSLEEFEALFYFNFIGLIAIALALTLNKVELFEGLISPY